MIAPARLVSYRILLQIAASDAHSDELLWSPEVDALSAVDRHLTTTLVLGTLRWQLALDERIRALLARPAAKLSPEAATALRMGAYQLIHLERVPAHAVIHDSVELVKAGREKGAAGMVNAVLRKIQGVANREQSTEKQGTGHRAPGSEKQSTVVAQWAHPAWMVERWVQRYGAEASEAICRWDQEPAGMTVRVDPETELVGMETEPGFFLSHARRVVRGDAGWSAALREGRIWIQDEASQLVAEMLANGLRLAAPADSGVSSPALRVLDLCAAPGGKTAVLAERLPAAEITAVDVSRGRLEAMKKRMPPKMRERLKFEAVDAATLELEPEWDLVLCDVPCSGTGTMARNPEIRLRVKEEDLARQHARQVALLRAGLKGLKPGGRLVYSTCSLEPEENQDVVAEVLGPCRASAWFRWRGFWRGWRSVGWSRPPGGSGCEAQSTEIFCGRCPVCIPVTDFSRRCLKNRDQAAGNRELTNPRGTIRASSW